MIGLESYEFFTLLGGWVLAILLFFFSFMVVKFTPAIAFLRAFMSKKGIARAISSSGICSFKVIKKMDKGSLEVDEGVILQTPNSHELYDKGKIPMFTFFSDYGYSIDPLYPMILEELREKGLNINNYRDYNNYLVYSRLDDEILDEKVQRKELTKAEVEVIKILKKKGLELKSKKTYNLKNLFFMFPNNISVDIVNGKIQEEINRRMKKSKQFSQNLMYIAIAVLIIVIALVIFLKSYKTPEPIIKFVTSGGVEMLAKNISNNLTI